MSTTMISRVALAQHGVDRPALDVVVERVALGLLQWTQHRAQLAEARSIRSQKATDSLTERQGAARARAARIARRREGDAERRWSASPFGH